MSYFPPNAPRPASPSADDDAAKGFRAGDHWVDTCKGCTWVCIDPTPRAAVWVRQDVVWIMFKGAGVYRPTTFFGQVWFNTTGTPRILTDVTLWHQTAGVRGDTVVDVLVNAGNGWTSVWHATPGNRPTLSTSLGGDASVSGGPMDSPAVPPGARVRVDIVSVQAGTPSGILVQATL